MIPEKKETPSKELRELRKLYPSQIEGSRLSPFDLSNSSLSAKHGLILGGPGSGKTFTTNLILTEFYFESEDNQIIVIDTFGGGYRKMCNLLGGQYLIIDPKASATIGNNRIIVFGLQRLYPADTLTQTIHSLFSTIEKIAGAKSGKKILVIDEFWPFEKNDVAARLLLSLYRTSVKFDTAILFISQLHSNFFEMKFAEGVVANSFLQYVLPLKPEFDLLPKFGFSQEEIEDIKTLRATKTYREVFLKTSEKRQFVTIQPSPIDYWIGTGSPDNIKAEYDLRKKHPEWSEIKILKELAGVTKK